MHTTHPCIFHYSIKTARLWPARCFLIPGLMSFHTFRAGVSRPPVRGGAVLRTGMRLCRGFSSHLSQDREKNFSTLLISVMESLHGLLCIISKIHILIIRMNLIYYIYITFEFYLLYSIDEIMRFWCCSWKECKNNFKTSIKASLSSQLWHRSTCAAIGFFCWNALSPRPLRTGKSLLWSTGRVSGQLLPRQQHRQKEWSDHKTSQKLCSSGNHGNMMSSCLTAQTPWKQWKDRVTIATQRAHGSLHWHQSGRHKIFCNLNLILNWTEMYHV